MAGKTPSTKLFTMRKAKQVGFIAVVSLGSVFLLNTLANRSRTVRMVQTKIGSGA